MHTTRVLIFSIFLLSLSSAFAQSSPDKPSINATRVYLAPEVDGFLDDPTWQESEVATDFKQYLPVYNGPSRFKTDIKIVYDDKAIYIAAEMYDPQPDSIKKELGLRDNDDLNVDALFIGLDTYFNHQDAYIFGVTASGVQIDKRAVDETYSAVWKSAVRITSTGWNAEFSIPYSALRLPTTKVQDWGLQVVREVRRNKENLQWSLEENISDNKLVYWGSLKGLTDINPPLRLSFLPYLSTSIQHSSSAEVKSDPYSFNYNGGMDVKWGLNESFTLDMILMPDFSQVQSDKVVKNLSAFEVVHDENRPFFNEGTDLFNKGGLFYSRRIGRTPANYYSVSDSLNDGEHLVSNPYAARLLNAVKVSGRTSSGLGVGFFNALTGNTWAIAADSSDNSREILTDPMTNYNIMVLDQSLKNNSSVYIINTNVTRPSGWNSSDVYGGGFRLSEKSNTYQLKFDISASTVTEARQLNDELRPKNKTGIYYNLGFNKIKGNFRYSIFQNSLDKNYNRNDLGVNRTRDWVSRGLSLQYNIYEPFGIFRRLSQTLYFNREQSLSTHKNSHTITGYKGSSTFTNYLTVFWNLGVSPFDRYDYYESRTENRVFLKPGYQFGSINFSSDYRKPLAFDGEFEIGKDYGQYKWYGFNVHPILRVSDNFKMTLTADFKDVKNDLGYVSNDTTAIFFGNRDYKTTVNTLSGDYMFNNKVSLSLLVRHYWQKGVYDQFYNLNNDGTLAGAHYTGDSPNYNYNSFNLDLVFGWEFSPGSMFNIVWKNAVQSEDQLSDLRYFKNFDNMMTSPQVNNVSLKILYYLDYHAIKNLAEKVA